MNFIKRAFISVKRKLGKSLILLLIVFILGNIIAGAISVKQAISSTDESIRKTLGSSYSLEIDYEELSKNSDFDWSSIEYLNSEQINKIGKNEYIKYFDYSTSISLQSKKINRYVVQTSDDGGIRPFVSNFSLSVGSSSSYFNLTGVEYNKILDIEAGTTKLHDGRVFTEEEISKGSNVILISKALAELNDLKVGSRITLQNIVYDFSDAKPLVRKEGANTAIYTPKVKFTEDIELEIIGIFEPEKLISTGNEEEDMYNQYMEEENQNKIYAPNKLIIKQNELKFDEENKGLSEDEKSIYVEYLIPTFILKDALDNEKFESSVKDLIPKNYKLTSSSDQYKNIAAPMFAINSLATVILYVAVCAALIILNLMITLFLRDRKHEMGIYLSLGEKKIKIAYQIVLEVLCVGFIGITLSLFTGNLIAKTMTQSMITNQLLGETENNASDDMFMGRGNSGRVMSRSFSVSIGGNGLTTNNITAEEIAQTYKVNLNMTIVLLFYVVGIMTLIISTVVPIMYVLRLNPKKILM